MAVRLSIQMVENDPAALQRLRDAYSAFKAVPDDRGFDFFASMHGLPLPFLCEHGSPLFLPWHRAYLYYFELGLQSRLGPRFTEVPARNPDFQDIGLPWWDWASDHAHAVGLPASYTANVQGGNPLSGSEVGACGGTQTKVSGVWSSQLLQMVRTQIPGAVSATDPPMTLRDPDQPNELPTQAALDQFIMQEPTYSGFNVSLEQVHNDVHVWIGGAMSQVPIAAYDPIFWAHHCMIDRLWYIWQNSMIGRDPPAALLNTVLAPFPMTVAQVLDIQRLDYDYAVTAIV